jgi:hypothetical protein
MDTVVEAVGDVEDAATQIASNEVEDCWPEFVMIGEFGKRGSGHQKSFSLRWVSAGNGILILLI